MSREWRNEQSKEANRKKKSSKWFIFSHHFLVLNFFFVSFIYAYASSASTSSSYFSFSIWVSCKRREEKLFLSCCFVISSNLFFLIRNILASSFLDFLGNCNNLNWIFCAEHNLFSFHFGSYSNMWQRGALISFFSIRLFFCFCHSLICNDVCAWTRWFFSLETDRLTTFKLWLTLDLKTHFFRSNQEN